MIEEVLLLEITSSTRKKLQLQKAYLSRKLIERNSYETVSVQQTKLINQEEKKR
jgi:hypothetical protein